MSGSCGISSTPSSTRTYRAPGRVNVIGEHIDYLGGSVLPFACDRELRIRVEPQPDVIALRSGGDDVAVAVDGSAEPPAGWGRHVWAVVRVLREAGIDVRGCRGEVVSDIPPGAGLSSSTALEVAVALAVTGGYRPAPELLQRAEQQATGVPCGVMDQTAMLHARAGHALLLDCSTGAFDHIPIPASIGFVAVDTGTRRELADGRYAQRRAEVEGGDPRRLRHAETEQARVYAAAEALRAENIAALGEILDASHASLRDDFEVSSDELDLAARSVREHRGCSGARLVGAGFAGCVLAVVEAGAEYDVAAWVTRRLRGPLPSAHAFAVRPMAAAGELTGLP